MTEDEIRSDRSKDSSYWAERIRTLEQRSTGPIDFEELTHILRKQVETLEAELHTVHNSPILRMCTMPGCLRQFDIRASVSGGDPEYPHWSSEGWASAGQFGHVCPDHREAVQEHRPRWGIPSLGAPRTATCACGWFLEQESAFNGFGIASWRNHLALVYRSGRNEEEE